MDEMRIKEGILAEWISKIICSQLKKKIGYKIEINLNEVSAKIIDGQTHIHLDADAEIDKEELIRIFTSLV